MRLSMQRTNWRDTAKAIFCVPAGRARNPRSHRNACANPRCAATTKLLPCSHACRTPNSTKSSTPQARNAASCWQPTSPKPRSPCRASDTSSTPASRASNAIPRGQSGAASRRKNLPKPPPPPTLQPLRTRLPRRVYPTVFRRRFQQPHRIHRPRNRSRSNLRRRHPAHGSIENSATWRHSHFGNARFAVYQ